MLGNNKAFNRSLQGSPSPTPTVNPNKVSIVAGEALGYPRAVVVDAGVAKLFNPSLYNQGSLLGITMQSVPSGATVDVLVAGELNYLGWGLTPNQVHYAVALGLVSNTPPVGLGFIQCLGVALDTDTLLLRPSAAISKI